MNIAVNPTRERAAEIRPGVWRPDWSAVTKPAARQALAGRRAARSGLLDMWSHALEASEDIVWRTVLLFHSAQRRPPNVAEIAAAAGISVWAPIS